MVEQVRGQGRGQGGGERKNLRMKERNLKGRGRKGFIIDLIKIGFYFIKRGKRIDNFS